MDSNDDESISEDSEYIPNDNEISSESNETSENSKDSDDSDLAKKENTRKRFKRNLIEKSPLKHEVQNARTRRGHKTIAYKDYVSWY